MKTIESIIAGIYGLSLCLGIGGLTNLSQAKSHNSIQEIKTEYLHPRSFISNNKNLTNQTYSERESNDQNIHSQDKRINTEEDSLIYIRSCVDECGDGYCAEIVCQEQGCPCIENIVNCPEDCGGIYFGYAMTANDDVGNGNYINEVVDLSNFTTIKSANVEEDIEKIKLASKYGAKSAVWIDRIFFNLELDDQGGLNDIDLYPDYKQRWEEYSENIEPYIDKIAMFYGLDEPYWNAYRCSKGLSSDEMKLMLEEVSDTVKSKFPKAKMANVFAAVPTLNANHEKYYVPERNDDFEIPRGYDYVGIDFYYVSSQRNSNNFDEFKKEYNDYFSFFKSKAEPHHKMIIIPDAFYFPSAPIPESEIIQAANFYYDLAKSDPSVKVFAPFLYPSIPQLTGAIDLPLVQEHYKKIGCEMLDIDPENCICPEITSFDFSQSQGKSCEYITTSWNTKNADKFVISVDGHNFELPPSCTDMSCPIYSAEELNWKVGPHQVSGKACRDDGICSSTKTIDYYVTGTCEN